MARTIALAVPGTAYNDRNEVSSIIFGHCPKFRVAHVSLEVFDH